MIAIACIILILAVFALGLALMLAVIEALHDELVAGERELDA